MKQHCGIYCFLFEIWFFRIQLHSIFFVSLIFKPINFSVKIVECGGIWSWDVEIHRHSVVGRVEKELRSVVSQQSVLTDQAILKIASLASVRVSNYVCGRLALVLRFNNHVDVGETGERVSVCEWSQPDFFLLLLFEISRWNNDVYVVASFGIFLREIHFSVVVKFYLQISADNINIYYDFLGFCSSYQIPVNLFGPKHVSQRLSFFEVHLSIRRLSVHWQLSLLCWCYLDVEHATCARLFGDFEDFAYELITFLITLSEVFQTGL